MNLFYDLKKIWIDSNQNFIISEKSALTIDQLFRIEIAGSEIPEKGDVVAIIGDFDPQSIYTLLYFLNKGCIVVPLTTDTKLQHEYFFNAASVKYIFEKNLISKREPLLHMQESALLQEVRKKETPGIIFFTSGTTGKPKAIIHDFSKFIARYKTPRPPLRTLSFLLFDHIGGINTLLHMLFNKGLVVSIKTRSVKNVLEICSKYEIELLPTTPTFLRMMLLQEDAIMNFPKSLKVISYGTERMDQNTLSKLCELFPDVSFRQTYGMSELGILRIKSKANDSLFMSVGGEGIQTKIINNILFIKSKSAMLGYLNATSPFDNEGWYNTKDIVEEEKGFIKVTGRAGDIINVGGLKFMPSDVEKHCLNFKGVKHAKVYSKTNPITGQHCEVLIETELKDFNKIIFKQYLASLLPKHMVPQRIKIEKLNISHRFKKL